MPLILRPILLWAAVAFALYAENAYAQTAPGPVRNLSATIADDPDPEGDIRITLMWQPPLDSGSAGINDYEIEFESVDEASVSVRTRFTQFAVDVVMNKVSTLTVTARNLDGLDGPPAEYVYTPPRPPGAVASLQAEAGFETIRVTWEAPAGSVTGYVVSWATKAEPSTELGRSPVISGTEFDIPDLTNGTEYTITVFAMNDDGAGRATTIDATPVAAPSAVTDLSVAPGDGELTVSWGAPEDSGSGDITAYIVSWQIGSNDPDSMELDSLMPDESDIYSYTIEGLTNGQRYTVSVVAQNDNEITGLVSETTAVPGTNPGDIPAGSLMLVTDGIFDSIMVSWDAVDDDGGAPPVEYVVTWSSEDAGRNEGSETVSETSYTIEDLDSVPTTVSVVAVNATGLFGGALSDATTPVPSLGAVTGLSVVAGNAQLTVSWGAPVDNGGADIVSYTVTWQIGSDPSSSTVRTVASLMPDNDRYSHTITGLTNGETYTVSVYATNADSIDGPPVESEETPRSALRLRLRVFLESALP